VFERTGYPNLLVGMNNDMYHGWRQLTVATNFGANVQLHDYTGHANDVWTDNFGNVTISIPPNDNGYGYVCYSRPGYAQPFRPKSRPTTQTFFGAADLDIPPLSPDQPVSLPRIWCQAGTTISVHVEAANTVAPSIQITDKTNTLLTRGAVKHTGWHSITLGKVALPVAGTGEFTATVTYMAPPTLNTAELSD
jgi:alpha-amylase